MGLPNLGAKLQKICDENNVLVVFCLDILEMSAELHDVMFLFEHPEDFGTAYQGDPASTFQLPRMQDAVSDSPLQRGALYQCDFEPDLGNRKPTGAITNIAHMLKHPLFTVGGLGLLLAEAWTGLSWLTVFTEAPCQGAVSAVTLKQL